MHGKIKVITGPMRSRKTLELILMAKDAMIAGLNVVSFHPDVSSKEGCISSKIPGSGGVDIVVTFPSHSINRDLDFITDILPANTDIVIFDDAQFFSNNIISICRELRADGIDVYVSGLDMDFLMQPFGPIPFLMAIADEVTKITAVCHDCQSRAVISYRLSNDKEILSMDTKHIPLCLDCYMDRKFEEKLDFNIGGKDE